MVARKGNLLNFSNRFKNTKKQQKVIKSSYSGIFLFLLKKINEKKDVILYAKVLYRFLLRWATFFTTQ